MHILQIHILPSHSRTSKQLLFVCKLQIKYSIDIIVFKDGPVASFVSLIDQEKCYVFLICIQKELVHFGEKSEAMKKWYLGCV